MNLMQLFVIHVALFCTIGFLLVLIMVLNQILTRLHNWLRRSEEVARLFQSSPGKMSRQYGSHAGH
ncbi:hypothetical protein [Gimesia sp.]|uniref:hypothetical protein n=1 Tax=Gimesia sp. TaxID=2024833 RepID=UPI003A8D5941